MIACPLLKKNTGHKSLILKFTPKIQTMKSKASTMLAAAILALTGAQAQVKLNPTNQRIAYENSYHFTAGIEMEIDFYDRKGNLDQSIPYFSYYNDDFSHIAIRHERGRIVYQTIFDLPNNNCLILLGEGDNLNGSAAVMKDNQGTEMKMLELENTGETKPILGHSCTRYTFDVKEFSGELWMTDEVDLPNDVGIFKASKTAKYYQMLSEDGFVMEITTTTPKGRTTVMRTTAMKPSLSFSVNIPDPFGRSLNRIDYYAY